MNGKMKFEKFSTYFLYFIVYSILGWLYEVFLEVVIYKWGFSNRGLLFGPYLPVYGTGALFIIAFTKNLIHKKIKIGEVNITPLLVFIQVVIITTIIELIASYLLQWTTGGWLWDYTSYKIQFEGRICLSASIRFGFGGLIILYIIQPFLIKLKNILTQKTRFIIFYITFIPFILDCINVTLKKIF